MSWDASIPLHDHLPTTYVVDGAGINLALLPQIEQDAVQEDKARWHLAHKMITTKSEHEIRRWLEERHPVYRQDMARRLNAKTGRTNTAGRPGQ